MEQNKLTAYLLDKSDHINVQIRDRLPLVTVCKKKGLCLLCSEVGILASGGRYFISGVAGQNYLML